MTPNPLNADAPDLLLKTWAERAGMANSAATTRFPAFLFNTTVVETGQPMAFATTEFPSNNFRKAFVELPHRYPVVVGFNALFDLYDGGAARDVGLSMVTAARMSSAFPYVSPAASPNWSAPPKDSGDAAKKKEEKKKGAKNYHLVDGGYYDNYGLVGLSQWLDDALTELKESASRPTRVTIVIVRDEEHPTADEVPQKGWLTQLVDPPLAFLQTRAYGHWAGGRAALKLLEEKWKGTVTIQDVAFVYPLKQVRSTHPECGTPPISWLMTATEDACVTYAWRASEPAILRFKQIAIPGALEGAPDAAAAPPAAEGLPTPASVSPPAARPHE
jgi:hypothetical protein